MRMFLSNISCSQAVVSCLPVVGSFVSSHRAINAKIALQNLDTKARLTAAFEGFTALSESEGLEEKEISDQAAQKAVKFYERKLELLRTTIDYSRCGVVSNLLTVATIVALIATGVISGGYFAMASFSLFGLVDLHRLYKACEELKLTMPAYANVRAQITATS